MTVFAIHSDRFSPMRGHSLFLSRILACSLTFLVIAAPVQAELLWSSGDPTNDGWNNVDTPDYDSRVYQPFTVDADHWIIQSASFHGAWDEDSRGPVATTGTWEIRSGLKVGDSLSADSLVAGGSTALATEALGGDIYGLETFRFTALDFQAGLPQGEYFISITPEDTQWANNVYARTTDGANAIGTTGDALYWETGRTLSLAEDPMFGGGAKDFSFSIVGRIPEPATLSLLSLGGLILLRRRR